MAKRSENDDSTTVREEGETEEENGEHWFASVLVGSGVGYATGTGETNANLPVSGSFASTSLGHVSPELGYWVAPDLLISAQGRIQVVTGPTELVDSTGRVYPPADVALALFVKASLFFGSETFVRSSRAASAVARSVTSSPSAPTTTAARPAARPASTPSWRDRRSPRWAAASSTS